MARIEVGAAIGSGFGLIRRRPLSVLAWGALPALLEAVVIAVMAPSYVASWAMLAQMMTNAGAGAPPPAPPPQLTQLNGLAQLFNLVQVFLGAVVSCAVWRAVLRPQQASFAYLRIGLPELFVALLTVGAGIAFGVGIFVMTIPLIIVGAVIGAVSQSATVAVVVGVILFLLIGGVVAAYVTLRFSLVGPMIVADGKFRFLESWTATKGRVGSLFLIGLGLFAVFLVIEIIFLALLIGVGAAVVAQYGGLQPFVAAIQHTPQAVFGKLWPLLATWFVLTIPVAGCFSAIASAPWARAYQDVADDHGPTSEVFA